MIWHFFEFLLVDYQCIKIKSNKLLSNGVNYTNISNNIHIIVCG